MSSAVIKFFTDKVVPEFEKMMEKFVMIVIMTIYFFYVWYKKFKGEEIDDFVIFLDKLEWFLIRKMWVSANDIEKNITQLNQKSIADKN